MVNKVDPMLRHNMAHKSVHYEILQESIVGLVQANLHSLKPFLPRMNNFLGHDDVVVDLSSRNKTTLAMANKNMQQRFHSISYNLCNSFTEDRAQADWPKL